MTNTSTSLSTVRRKADSRPASSRVLDGIIGVIASQLADLERLEAFVSQTQAVPPEIREVVRFQVATLDYGVTAHRSGHC